MKAFTKLKHSLGVSNKEANRNDLMVADVRAFAQHLKTFHQEFNLLNKSVTGGLSTVRSLLLNPLPRAYDVTPTGVQPSDPETHMIGLTVQPDGLSTASHEVQQRLQQEVMAPLEQWLAEYRTTKEHHLTCERVRVAMKAQQDVVGTLQEKFVKHREINHKDTEALRVKLETEKDKLNRLVQQYGEQEASVFNALVRLIRDSASLKDFIASALAILQRCFTTAYTTFEQAPPPPTPQLPNPAVFGTAGAAGGPGTPGTEHGSHPWTDTPPAGQPPGPADSARYGSPPAYPADPAYPAPGATGAAGHYNAAPTYGAAPAYGSDPAYAAGQGAPGHYGGGAAPAYGSDPMQSSPNPYAAPP